VAAAFAAALFAEPAAAVPLALLVEPFRAAAAAVAESRLAAVLLVEAGFEEAPPGAPVLTVKHLKYS
jgi:hypothetical protein